MLGKTQIRVELTVPYDRYDAMQLIRTLGTVLSEAHEGDGTHVAVLMEEQELWRVKNALQSQTAARWENDPIMN